MGQKLVYVGMVFKTRRRKERVQRDQSSRNAVDRLTLMAVRSSFCIQLLSSLVIARFAKQEWDGQYST